MARTFHLYSTHFDPLARDGISTHFEALALGLAARHTIATTTLLTKASPQEAARSPLVSSAFGAVRLLFTRTVMAAALPLAALRGRIAFPAGEAGAPPTLFLFGYHWVLLIPFLRGQRDMILIAFDCWSDREGRLAQREGRPLHRLARRAFAGLLRRLEIASTKRIAGLALVSTIELEKFCAALPPPAAAALRAKTAILPAKAFRRGPPRALPVAGPVRLLLWADARTGYGVEGVARFFEALQRRPEIMARIEITLLSRAADPVIAAAVEADVAFQNLAFVDTLDDFLETFDLILLPDIDGSGVKNRTLQSIAAGAIVLATEVAAEGIDPGLRQALAPAPTMDALIDQLGALLDDPDSAGAKARQLGTAFDGFLGTAADQAAWEQGLIRSLPQGDAR